MGRFVDGWVSRWVDRWVGGGGGGRVDGLVGVWELTRTFFVAMATIHLGLLTF